MKSESPSPLHFVIKTKTKNLFTFCHCLLLRKIPGLGGCLLRISSAGNWFHLSLRGTSDNSHQTQFGSTNFDTVWAPTGTEHDRGDTEGYRLGVPGVAQ